MCAEKVQMKSVKIQKKTDEIRVSLLSEQLELLQSNVSLHILKMEDILFGFLKISDKLVEIYCNNSCNDQSPSNS